MTTAELDDEVAHGTLAKSRRPIQSEREHTVSAQYGAVDDLRAVGAASAPESPFRLRGIVVGTGSLQPACAGRHVGDPRTVRAAVNPHPRTLVVSAEANNAIGEIRAEFVKKTRQPDEVRCRFRHVRPIVSNVSGEGCDVPHGYRVTQSEGLRKNRKQPITGKDRLGIGLSKLLTERDIRGTFISSKCTVLPGRGEIPDRR